MPLARRTLLLTTLALPLLLGACATPPGAAPADAVQLPLQKAWFDGKAVLYITTDVSDAEEARARGVNFVPRLKDYLPESPQAGQRAGSGLERVYAFADKVQPPVFPSVPFPVGAGSKNVAYTPMWRMVVVHWRVASARRELKSEEAILDAEDRGEVRLVTTDVVLNCPVLAVDGGGAMPSAGFGARFSGNAPSPSR